MSDAHTRYGKLKGKLLNHPVIAMLAVIAIPVGIFLAIADNASNLISRIKGKEANLPPPLQVSEPVQKNEAVASNFMGISLESAIKGLDKKKYTSLQVQQFMARVKGSISVWQGKVIDVRGPEGSLGTTTLLAIAPLEDKSGLDIYFVRFQPADADSLNALSRDDIVTVQGELNFSEFGTRMVPELTNSKLLSFEKPSLGK
jgi:hypothetical protein